MSCRGSRLTWRRVLGWLVVIAFVATACSSAASNVTETVVEARAEPQLVTPTPASTTERADEPVATDEASRGVAATTPTPEPTPEPTAESVVVDSEPSAPAAVPAAASTPEPQPSCARIEDFGDDAAGRWVVVNDGVMGGLSFGNVRVGGGILRFEGTINTNGGGFSLVETLSLRDGATLVDALDGADFFRLRVRSEFGRGYELIAEDSLSRSSSQIMHFAPLNISETGVWQELSIRFEDFGSRFFGRPTIDEEAFAPELARSIGIILADGADGEFAIEIDQIDACRS